LRDSLRLRQLGEIGDFQVFSALPPLNPQLGTLQQQAGRQGEAGGGACIAQLLHQVERSDGGGKGVAAEPGCAFQDKADEVLQIGFDRQVLFQ